MLKFLLYLLRWQLSTIIMYPVMWLLVSLMITNTVVQLIAANLVGGIVFFFIDRWILTSKQEG